MKPRISMITLGVRDLEESVRFYEQGLGLPRMNSPPEVAFFTRGGRGLLYCAAAVLVVACSPSVDTEGRAADWLVDLGSVYCSPLPVVSFSANRDWMLFWTRYFHTDADTGRRSPILSPALLEVDRRRLVLPAGPADRVEGPSFSPSSLCWDDAGQGVFVRSSGQRGDAERPWYRADIGPDSELVPVSAPPESCRRPPEVEWQSHREAVIPDEVRGGLQVLRDGCCAVELRLADGRPLVRHEARSSLSDQVSVGSYAWSDSRVRLAYTLHEETSWRFARPTRSFVVEKTGQPDLLDGQVYAFAWRGDDELLACAARPRAEGGGSSLKMWRFDAGNR
ncbi:hypothetical protein [Thioalkalivibrio sp.]|uniref:hypothetical protein n=1 Tax=Thioalkalivibrio sp. TaxID=2093813 RepID=UPI0035682952